MDKLTSATLTDQLMAGAGSDSRVSLVRALLGVQTAVRMMVTKLRTPGLQEKKDVTSWADRLWLENLMKSRSFKYIITSKSKVTQILPNVNIITLTNKITV